MIIAAGVAGLAVLSACNGTETRSPTPDVDATMQAASPSGSGTPATPATGGTGTAPAASCTSDADCRTFGSYCSDAPCACKALAKSAPDPTCAGTKVECLAAPCMSKAAACQGGRCELVPSH
jgi:hypothetical protein